jgi:molybdopterin-containing oxidoreductase family iron-sulfur binding subunit
MKPTKQTDNPSSDASAPPASRESHDHEMSRRGMMAGLAKMGLTTLAVGAGAAEIIGYRDEAHAATMPDEKVKHAWCMVIDLRQCDGCAACTMACQARHELPKDHTWIKVYKMTDVSGNTYHMPRPCMMCQDPPCVKICPVGANFRTDEGLVLVDQDACIGRRAGMAACPYDARYFNWEEPPKGKARMPMPPSPEMPVPQQKGTVGKCVLCADRLPHGELPACITGCPMGALYVGDFVTDVAVNSRGNTMKLSEFLKENDAVRFKEELGTNPRVYYILGHGQDLRIQS